MTTNINNWEKSLIWFSLQENTPWKPGEVISCCRSSSQETNNEWIFQIKQEQQEEENQQELIENLSIITKSIDNFNLEFLHIKKREKRRENISNLIDMTSLSFLNEPEMIECLQRRYFEKFIYTNIGPILIAINPFEELNEEMYSIETIKKYFHYDPSNLKKLDPHVFQVSVNAYFKMFIDKYDANKRENQAILINGESGAGKTESTKQVLRFLATNSTELLLKLNEDPLHSRDIESLINAVNPITESFGNAKTSRNNNSSRFGKFIELCYSETGFIIGAQIQTYLLETIRVISQLKGERNFHIFYEVFTNLTEEQKNNWCCNHLTEFFYLNQSNEYQRYDGESDFENFGRVVDALITINLTMEQVTYILQIIISILHIGNIQFVSSQNVGEDVAILSSKSLLHSNQVCQLLGIEESYLITAFTKRGIKVAGNYILKNLNVENAIISRDTYAKILYDLLFKTLLQYINDSLSLENNNTDDKQASSIGVLDIFGFEHFEKNSFEQIW